MRRVEIPAYTDRWMMGDRYGTVVKTYNRNVRVAGGSQIEEIAQIKLDKSGKTIKVFYKDCLIIGQRVY